MIFIIYTSLALASDLDLESKKINCLISKIQETKSVFIRNGSKHTPLKAAKHIRMKYMRASTTGWPFYKKRKISPRLFIDKIASSSSFSGKDYKIEIDNKTLLVKDWLNTQLKKSCRTDQVQ